MSDLVATRPHVARRTRPAAWWGILMLIAAEGTLFGCFFGTYYYLRFNAAQWPPAGVPEPRVVVPLVLVACLAATSLPMQLAADAARNARLQLARLLLVPALVVQCGYVAFEIHDFADQLKQFDPTTNAYGSIYYVLLGADHAHVVLGVLLVVWLIGKLVRGLTSYRINAAQAIAWYWHAVNLLTLCVVATLLSARL